MKESIYKHNYDGNLETGNSYNGLVIHCPAFIHETILDYFKKNIDINANILILGSGTGALEARLWDHGYKNINSFDINKINYKYKNEKIKFYCGNLNENFSEIIDNKFDVIVATETIEHLYSTNSFLLNVQKCLKKKGKLLITTPNVHEVNSRLYYLATGYPILFLGVPKLYEHVNPIFFGILSHYCELLSLELKIVKTVGSFTDVYKPMKRRILDLILNIFSLSIYFFRFCFRLCFKNMYKQIVPKELDRGMFVFYELINK